MRPSMDDVLMALAIDISRRSECRRRATGAVIVDKKYNILSTGFNGVAPGQTPCLEKPCPGATSVSGTDLDMCEASHAEISALVRLREPFEAHKIYCTTEPCIQCVKALLLTPIDIIVYRDPYPSPGTHLWARAGRRSVQLSPK